jgi:hypothetical protein
MQVCGIVDRHIISIAVSINGKTPTKLAELAMLTIT